MAIRCGIVGLPNVGKSTLFNALTAASVPAERYPFCTIEPNVGIVVVPDPRLERIAAIVHPKTTVPTAIEFVDIAGLVAGASQGEGLGNKFLAHIREVDAILHVVRCFKSEDVAHVSGAIDPVADIEIVNTELVLADLEAVERGMERWGRRARAGDKDAGRVMATLETVHAHLAGGAPVRGLASSDEGRRHIRELNLLTIKPVAYIANVDEAHIEGNPLVREVEAFAAAESSAVVEVAAEIEGEIAQLDEADKAEFLAEIGEIEPGLNRVIRAAYALLGLSTFFTHNEKEARAWTYQTGSTAPQAAGKIHTDFERGFIRAEVVSYDDFVAYGGEHGAREAGRWRQEGKDYVVQDGDVILFRFNV